MHTSQYPVSHCYLLQGPLSSSPPPLEGSSPPKKPPPEPPRVRTIFLANTNTSCTLCHITIDIAAYRGRYPLHRHHWNQVRRPSSRRRRGFFTEAAMTEALVRTIFSTNMNTSLTLFHITFALSLRTGTVIVFAAATGRKFVAQEAAAAGVWFAGGQTTRHTD